MQLKKYYKKIVILFFFIITIFSIKNLGYFFDITQQAIKSDVILCLGGGSKNRIKKTFELYQNEYSLRNKILITDISQHLINKKVIFLKREKLKDENIIYNSKTFNTYEELKFAKEFMIKNNYKSIIIISSEPHSKRIDILISNFLNFSENNIKYTIVGEDADWWDKEEYYYNNKAIFFILRELIKIIYNYLFYSIDSTFKFETETIKNLIEYRKLFF
jgi:hypothetical protein